MYVDQDKTIGYETNGIGRKILNSFLVPTLNILPSRARWIIKKTHRSADEVITNATTHQAIETLYRKGDHSQSSGLIKKLFQMLWFQTDNAKAVRNRLRLVKKNLKQELIKRAGSEPTKLLSIASGSARAIVEATLEIDQEIPDNSLSVTFVDKNPKANEYSKQLAKDANVRNLQWYTGTISDFFKSQPPTPTYDIVEMVGLMDYFEDAKVIEVCKQIRVNLVHDGVLIIANISDNKERRFVTDVIGWKMIYRSTDEFVALLLLAGFERHKMKIQYEPVKIHYVVTAEM